MIGFSTLNEEAVDSSLNDQTDYGPDTADSHLSHYHAQKERNSLSMCLQSARPQYDPFTQPAQEDGKPHPAYAPAACDCKSYRVEPHHRNLILMAIRKTVSRKPKPICLSKALSGISGLERILPSLS